MNHEHDGKVQTVLLYGCCADSTLVRQAKPTQLTVDLEMEWVKEMALTLLDEAF